MPVTGLGDQAYQAGGSYVAVLRGEVFVSVSVAVIPNADRTANAPVPDGLMVSIARAVLARLPTE